MPEAPDAPWWGRYDLAEGQAGRWGLGPSTFWIYHAPREWRVLHQQDESRWADATVPTVPLPDDEARRLVTEPPTGASVQRYSFSQVAATVHLRPMLADLPIVIRPETPLYVLPKEAVTLYVSTPLWVAIDVGEPAVTLQVTPALRPPDTWFGPSTQEGEFCYAIRTAARLKQEDLLVRRYRAITPVQVHNRSAEVFLLERLQLPVQHLALYESRDHVLWSQAVKVERNPDGVMASVHIERGAPKEVVDAQEAAGPRQAPPSSTLLRRFASLFSI